VDWRLVPAAVLILFALWILAALALACSTRFDMIPTLAICSALFLVGIMSDYLFGRRAEPVWRHDLTEEVNSARWTEGQRSLLKGIVIKYDQDKDGKLEPVERDKIGAEDQARLRQAGMGGAWWASVLYTVMPNWQLFWVADALDAGRSVFHWNYVFKAFVYMAAYVGAALAVAVLLFQERELS
jgi:ABC-type Fe3+-siderophore transport system permease subunit